MSGIYVTVGIVLLVVGSIIYTVAETFRKNTWSVRNELLWRKTLRFFPESAAAMLASILRLSATQGYTDTTNEAMQVLQGTLQRGEFQTRMEDRLNLVPLPATPIDGIEVLLEQATKVGDDRYHVEKAHKQVESEAKKGAGLFMVAGLLTVVLAFLVEIPKENWSGLAGTTQATLQLGAMFGVIFGIIFESSAMKQYKEFLGLAEAENLETPVLRLDFRALFSSRQG